jgi:hypothetical protein
LIRWENLGIPNWHFQKRIINACLVSNKNLQIEMA